MSAITILGIPLTKPSFGDVFAFGVVSTFGVFVVSWLVMVGLFKPDAAVGLSAAIAGGSFAASVGVRFPEHGWRGLVVMGLFGLLAVGIAGMAMKLFF